MALTSVAASTTGSETHGADAVMETVEKDFSTAATCPEAPPWRFILVDFSMAANRLRGRASEFFLFMHQSDVCGVIFFYLFAFISFVFIFRLMAPLSSCALK